AVVAMQMTALAVILEEAVAVAEENLAGDAAHGCGLLLRGVACRIGQSSVGERLAALGTLIALAAMLAVYGANAGKCPFKRQAPAASKHVALMQLAIRPNDGQPIFEGRADYIRKLAKELVACIGERIPAEDRQRQRGNTMQMAPEKRFEHQQQ